MQRVQYDSIKTIKNTITFHFIPTVVLIPFFCFTQNYDLEAKLQSFAVELIVKTLKKGISAKFIKETYQKCIINKYY